MKNELRKDHQSVMLELLIELDRICKKYNIQYILFAGSALGAVRHKGFIPWDDDLDVALLREDYEKLLDVPNNEWNENYYLQREFTEHWPMYFSKLRKNCTTCLEKYHPKDVYSHQGIYIDIFPVDNASDNPIIRKMQFMASRIVLAKSFYQRGYDTKSILKKSIMVLCRFFPLKPFHNMVVLKSAKNGQLVHSFLGGTSSYEKGIYSRKWFEYYQYLEFEGVIVPVSYYSDDMLKAMYGDYMRLPPIEERECKVHTILIDTEKDYTEYKHYRDEMKFDVLTKSIR